MNENVILINLWSKFIYEKYVEFEKKEPYHVDDEDEVK